MSSGRHFVAMVDSFQQLTSAIKLSRDAMLAHCGRVTNAFTGK